MAYVSRRHGRWFAGIAFVLACLIPITWGLKQIVVDNIERDLPQRQTEAVVEARTFVVSAFEVLQQGLRDQARGIASTPVVQQGLKAARGRADFTYLLPEQAATIAFFDRVEIEPYTAVELYSARGQLLAWKGFSMDRTPSERLGISSVQTGTVSDEYDRQALVLWYPVREGDEVIGAVRVVRLVEEQVDIPSPYQQSYRLVDTWTAQVQAPLDVRFGTGGNTGVGNGVRLRGIDGTILGIARVFPPEGVSLVQQVVERFEDVQAFWTALLLGWLFAGIWQLYRFRISRVSVPGPKTPVLNLGVSLLLVALAWWGFRYGLLALDVPGRWFDEGALFDPVFLASTLGGGLMRSIGDMLITAGFAFLFALVLWRFAERLTFPQLRGQDYRLADLWVVWMRRVEEPRPAVFGIGVVLIVSIAIAGVALLGIVTHRAVQDSTLDYFAWTGLSPRPMVLVVFGTLLLGVIAIVISVAALGRMGIWRMARFRPVGDPSTQVGLLYGILALIPFGIAYLAFDLGAWVQPWAAMGFLLVVGWVSVWGGVRIAERTRLLFFRNILLIVLGATWLVYPLIYRAMNVQRHVRMVAVAGDNVEHKDAEARLLLVQVLETTRANAAVQEGLTRSSRSPEGDSLAISIIKGIESPFMDEFSVRLSLLDDEGRLLGQYAAPGTDWKDDLELRAFETLQRTQETIADEPVIRPVEDHSTEGRVYSSGFVRLSRDSLSGWAQATIAERAVRYARQSPTFTITGDEDVWRSKFAIAEYRGGRFEWSEGKGFEELRLPAGIPAALDQDTETWQTVRIHGQAYETYYRLRPEGSTMGSDDDAGPVVIAVRTRALIPYDHMYYILRVVMAGLAMGGVFYVIGLALRYRTGRLPGGRTFFGDRVQNAFLGIGLVAVVAMGYIGQQVIFRENEGAIQSRLERRLQRVEEALYRSAQPGEQLHQVLMRVPIETLARELSLDLNVYNGATLVATSRPAGQIPLIDDDRLPIDAYDQLYRQGYRQAFVEVQGQRGAFFTIGYKALVDEQAQTRAVIAVLTIPEQERIQEERARTTAYLFGALLLLLLAVMVTATVLARTLSQPVRRLRAGLESVAAGRFQQPIPVESRDEFGGLVKAFNQMQEQLAESRRQLGQQERELAWREMAKQVAHEIKNPLTPMKLSIQHLQRAYNQTDQNPSLHERFSKLFHRITSTLTEQIDTLAHIANEFSTFARLPKRHLEVLDLNATIHAAANLLREETNVAIDLDLHDQPLVIEADRDELQRVYINLLKNAVQAIPATQVGRITVQTWPEQAVGGNGVLGHACSTITDTGTGIPPGIRERIFQPNFSTKTSGMGLGLAIVKKSIEDMRGEIDFETVEDQGTTFRIRLPLAE